MEDRSSIFLIVVVIVRVWVVVVVSVSVVVNVDVTVAVVVDCDILPQETFNSTVINSTPLSANGNSLLNNLPL